MITRVRALLLRARLGRRRALARLPCTSDRTATRAVIGATPSAGMTKLSVASQATSPSTVATPRPRPNRMPSFSIVTSRRSTSPGTTIRLKRQSSMPANSPIRIAEPRLLRDVDRHRLGQRLDLEDAGHDRQAREVALEEPLGRGHALDPDDPLRRRVVLDDPIDEQDRPAMRDQRLDLAGRVDRLELRGTVEAGGVAVSVTGGLQRRWFA